MNVTSRLSEMAAQMSWSALAIRAPSVVTPLKTGREQCPRCHLGRLPFPLLPFEMKHCWISFCGTSAVSEEDQNTSQDCTQAAQRENDRAEAREAEPEHHHITNREHNSDSARDWNGVHRDPRMDP